MTGAEPAGPPGAAPPPAGADDGWRRLHPATPLLRGGVVVIAILVWIIVQLRDVWLALVLGDLVGDEAITVEDPASRWVVSNVGLALAGVAVLLIVILVGGWLSWRMHSYRVTADIVEEREGVIWRKHRRARLDRIQGVNVERPLLARIFGAARIDIAVAGEDANIRLYALRSADANALRAELLTAASRARAEEAAPGAAAAAAAAAASAPVAGPVTDEGEAPHSSLTEARPPGLVSQRIQEFTAPELDSTLSAPDSIVHMDVGRLIGSTVLSLAIPVLAIAAAVIVPVAVWRTWGVLFVLVPGIIGFGAYAIRRITRSLRYSIAGTEHGIRVGFGLLSTTNETLPAGRIHAIEVTQPLLWRPFGWWSVRINRASRSTRDGAAGQSATTILPVGDAAEVAKVLDLIVPDLDLRDALERWEAGGDAVGADAADAEASGGAAASTDPMRGDAVAAAAVPEYVTSPDRARIFRWFSWRRNGYRLTEEAVLLRKGAIWRTLTVVPFARVQSVALSSGPIARATGLRRVAVHTVMGQIVPTIGALDVADAETLASETESRTLQAMASAR